MNDEGTDNPQFLPCWRIFNSLILVDQVNFNAAIVCHTVTMTQSYITVTMIQSLERGVSCEAQCRTGCESAPPIIARVRWLSQTWWQFIFFDIPSFPQFSLDFTLFSPLWIWASARRRMTAGIAMHICTLMQRDNRKIRNFFKKGARRKIQWINFRPLKNAKQLLALQAQSYELWLR
jgi:hypothetical protein